jgi:PAS domain S-box-containing protein
MPNANATLEAALRRATAPAAVVAAALGTLTLVARVRGWAAVTDLALPALVVTLWLLVGAIVLARRLHGRPGDEALHELSQQLAASHAAVPVGIATLDFEGRVHLWNPAAERIFGWTSDEVIGKPLPVVPPGNWGAFMGRLARVRAGERLTDLRLHVLRKDHSYVEVAIIATPLVGKDGKTTGASIVYEDLTERQRITRALEESEQRLRFIIEHTTDSIYIKDLAGRYVLANRVAAEVIAGVPVSALLGKRDEEVFTPETVRIIRAADARVLERDEPETFEIPATSLHGHRGVYLSTKFPFRSPSGELLGIIGIARNISERKQLEETMRQQYEQIRDLDRLKTDLVNAVSHDLRSPLTAIIGYAELTQDALDEHERERLGDYLTQIIKGTRRMERMVEDLLDFARLESGTFELTKDEADFRFVVSEILESFRPLAQASRVTLRAELPEAPMPVRIDVARMQRVLANLIGNALKFTPEGGEVRVQAATQNGQLRCMVVDTGIGIAPEEQSQLFRRFSQLEAGRQSRGGLGLGLWISRALVEAHGGHIGVTSEPGRGSTFWFTLPTMRPEVPQASQRGAASKPH